MKYTYDYPMPAIAADIIVLGNIDDCLHILLVKRKNEPFKNKWALPGGFMNINEKIINTALRELEEETGIKLKKKLLHFFSYYDEPKRDPRGRIISCVFFTILENCPQLKPADDVKQAKWFSIFNIPKKLAFDHNKIIEDFIKKSITNFINQDFYNEK
ncbi:MAG: NUDIX hydrolase [Bacteroidales bacterium]|nr:NUDIX hydrolase [Bacteroidales bacterium]